MIRLVNKSNDFSTFANKAKKSHQVHIIPLNLDLDFKNEDQKLH